MTTDPGLSESGLENAIRSHISVAHSAMDLVPAIASVGAAICAAFEHGHRLYAFGNGGSAAEAQHLVAEFVGRFARERRALPAVSLTTDPSVITCIGNDFDFDHLFARQVTALVTPGDIVVGFTTSGTSANVVAGLAAARAVGATTVLIGAGDGADAASHADHHLLVQASDPARVQEMHLLLLHLLSETVDQWAAATDGR